MSGKSGMRRKSDCNAIRRKIWRSIRILRRFTQPDLMRTVPGATEHNVKKYVAGLLRHGYIGKYGAFVSGRAGQQQSYQLLKDTGSDVHPTRCERCGNTIGDHPCKTQEEIERETETKKETEEAPAEVIHDAA